MKKYIVICNKDLAVKHPIIVKQYICASPNEACKAFLNNFFNEKITDHEHAEKLIKSELRVSLPVIKIIKIRSVWCSGFLLNNNNYSLNIIEEPLDQSDEPFYTIVAYFKKGIYVYQYKSSNAYEALKEWTRHLSWRYYERNERDIIKKSVGNGRYKHLSFTESHTTQGYIFFIQRRKLVCLITKTKF